MKWPTGARVIVKVDWNIPDLHSPFRIEQTIPTIKKLLKDNKVVVVVTHWGRPNGSPVSALSTEKMVPILSKILKNKKVEADIVFIDQHKNFQAALNTARSCGIKKTIILLQNTRFFTDEASSDSKKRQVLAKQYAGFGEFYIDEAFSLSHRKEATNTELKALLPHGVGLCYKEETQVLKDLREDAEHPFLLVLGGAKIETKLPLLKKLAPKVDKIFLGGQILFTFLAATGKWPFDSYVDEKYVNEARQILKKFETKIILAEAEYAFVGGKKVGVDVGHKFIHSLAIECRSAKTIFWNGCMGLVEKGFVQGNQSVAYTIATSDAYVVVGGGDTVASIRPDVLEAIDFVSTGGGATLEYLAK